MRTTIDTSIELDHRLTDGIDVRLLWHPAEDRVSVTALDTRDGQTLELDVRPYERALDVFHHPYAYAAFHGVRPRRVGDGDLTAAGAT